jgi:hypothetical protein
LSACSSPSCFMIGGPQLLPGALARPDRRSPPDARRPHTVIRHEPESHILRSKSHDRACRSRIRSQEARVLSPIPPFCVQRSSRLLPSSTLACRSEIR